MNGKTAKLLHRFSAEHPAHQYRTAKRYWARLPPSDRAKMRVVMMAKLNEQGANP